MHLEHSLTVVLIVITIHLNVLCNLGSLTERFPAQAVNVYMHMPVDQVDIWLNIWPSG